MSKAIQRRSTRMCLSRHTLRRYIHSLTNCPLSPDSTARYLVSDSGVPPVGTHAAAFKKETWACDRKDSGIVGDS